MRFLNEGQRDRSVRMLAGILLVTAVRSRYRCLPLIVWAFESRVFTFASETPAIAATSNRARRPESTRRERTAVYRTAPFVTSNLDQQGTLRRREYNDARPRGSEWRRVHCTRTSASTRPHAPARLRGRFHDASRSPQSRQHGNPETEAPEDQGR